MLPDSRVARFMISSDHGEETQRTFGPQEATAKSRGYTTPTGYVDAPSTAGHGRGLHVSQGPRRLRDGPTGPRRDVGLLEAMQEIVAGLE